ncbi:hypothetical protein ANDA3_0008 [plant metagenome]|uniref:Uncharacterized protein n=2 Tax=root TaxID=1 RepID=A0A1C3K651_9BURK|nr:hypothetical protein ODI_01078 [Orrella dioscoreae]SOE52573.1 hypothetical protein ODI_R4301 [Orrella dioscoreae]
MRRRHGAKQALRPCLKRRTPDYITGSRCGQTLICALRETP